MIWKTSTNSLVSILLSQLEYTVLTVFYHLKGICLISIAFIVYP